MRPGPVPAQLDRLLDPDTALTCIGVNDVDSIADTARSLHQTHDWVKLADLYRGLFNAASKHRTRDGLRVLLAEQRVAARLGDADRVREVSFFLAQQHRLSGGFTAAEAWLRTLVAEEPTDATAVSQVRAWRELAAVREVAADYEDGLRCCDHAVAIASAFPYVTGAGEAHIQALLQKSVILRHQGSLDEAARTLDEARQRASGSEVSRKLQGLIELRQGGLDLVIGLPVAALSAYRRAAAHFIGVSENNLALAQLRQVACLRALDRTAEALQLTSRLRARYRATGDTYRLGQVLLERAEVQQARGDNAEALISLEECRPFYEHGETLEALRWHTHQARIRRRAGDQMERTRRHLMTVLRLAARPGRRDLTRTMLALSALPRAGLTADLSLVASRTALAAADHQRDSLTQTRRRWALHGQREEVYSEAILLHAHRGDGLAVAQIAETGRADLLNQMLAGHTSALTDRIVVPADPRPETAEEVFSAALAVADMLDGVAIAAAPVPPLPGGLPDASHLDSVAEKIVVLHLGGGPGGWWSCAATRSQGDAWQVLIRNAPDEVGEVVNQLVKGGLFPASRMSQALWEKISAFLLPDDALWSPGSTRSLLLAPDPRLWHVPYAALSRDGITLADVIEFSVTPSLRTISLLEGRVIRPVSGAAVSLLDSNLPGTLIERAALEGWPGGHRPAASLAEATGCALLYVNGHGGEPGMAGTLGPESLTLGHLATSKLPPLVVLNGCWSGTAKSVYGQDPLSLAIGGLLGGAGTVVGGVGPIGGIPSAHVAARMLALVGEGLPVRSALRRAQLEVRAQHPYLGPFDWAGLCVVGLGR